jgi:predicted Rossmann-fold nucleotide-binding protein
MDEFPVLPFRSTLYTPDELFAGFRPDDPASYATTADLRAYRSTRLVPNREVGMLRALHDQCITEARDELVAGRRVVAVMGGHAMARTDVAYRDVAQMAARLAGRGDLVASGGGPGAMEASHLGALVSPSGPDALIDALGRLAVAPAFPRDTSGLVAIGGAVDVDLLGALHAWQRPAFEVLASIPAADRGESLAVPTWFYGHEPPTPFASHLAKYFSNSLREDGLLAIAKDGIVFAPGRAGTLQEVFQEAAQNFYRVFHDRFSPMAFLDTDRCWTERFPVGPILSTLFGADDFERYVCISPDPDELVAFLSAAPARSAPPATVPEPSS